MSSRAPGSSTRRERRTAFDWVMAHAPRPRVLESYRPPPRRIDDGLYVVDRRESFGGRTWLVFRTTIAVQPDGGLWVHAPIPLDPEVRREVDRLGPVRAIVAPNAFHYLSIAEWHAAYPDASLHFAPGLPERAPKLPRGAVLGAESTFDGLFDVHVLGPIRGLSEAVFVHRPSRSLILTDLAKNVSSIEDCMEPGGSRLRRLEVRGMLFAMGSSFGFGADRNVRMAYLHDRERVRPDLRAIVALDFERIIVNHGEIVEREGPKLFAEAFAAWL